MSTSNASLVSESVPLLSTPHSRSLVPGLAPDARSNAATLETPSRNETGKPTQKAPRKQGAKLLVKVLVVLLVLGVAGRYASQWWVAGRFVESTEDAYLGADISTLSAKVPGFIAQVPVTDNQVVRKGDLLVKLDARDYGAALSKADAAVAIQEATMVNLSATRRWQESVVRQAEAGVAAADSEVVRTRDDLARYSKLSAESVISLQELQKNDADFKQATAKQQAAQATLEAAKRHLEVLDTQREQIQAALSLAKADREMAQLNLGYTEIRAPIDGVVGNRSARQGAYATTGSQVLSIVPSRGVWVDANFKESQVGKIRAGDAARIKVDLLPNHVLRGHVHSIAPATGALFSLLPPENATGNFTKIVQRVTVRILLDDESMEAALLRPGLSVVAEVETKPTTRAGL